MARASRPARETTQRVPVAMPEEPRAAAWLREFRPSGFAIAVLMLIVACLVVLAPSLKTFVEQQQQIARLQQDVRDAQREVDDLTVEIARWDDPAYIEAQARDRLYYVYPGDHSYLVVGDSGLLESGQELPISDEIQTQRVDWLRAILGSVYEAGLTEKTPEELDTENRLDSPVQQGSGG